MNEDNYKGMLVTMVDCKAEQLYFLRMVFNIFL